MSPILSLAVLLARNSLNVITSNDQWRDKEATRDAVRVAIKNFLWSDETGLPISRYDENDVAQKADDVFRHVYWAYPRVPSPYYEAATT